MHLCTLTTDNEINPPKFLNCLGNCISELLRFPHVGLRSYARLASGPRKFISTLRESLQANNYEWLAWAS